MARPADRLLWQRWDEVDRHLSAALALPIDQREGHIRAVLPDDGPLRDLLLRLLSRIANDDDTAPHPPERDVLAAFSSGDGPGELEALAPGELVGRYRVVQRIGRGGMATVYEAERADGAYEQRVALKVLRKGLDTEDLVRRFLAERQILSKLAHPNIARLLDGGSTDTGRPYLVMELVPGQPITTWADQHSLGTEARLRLFLDVAEAVQAAHRQMVVHRDIKPSNVLVDQDGRVKLLDFGIAKLLDRDDALSDVRTSALTPEYASPEQLDGNPITTGTDVFQLGLLLRELLTGVPPRAGGSPTDPISRPSRAVSLEVEGLPSPAMRASVRATQPERLARRLRGELDIIVGKATRPVPSDRYGSAGELRSDVERFLDGRPISAHPESVVYRTRKFTSRHPFFVPGAFVIVVGILAFMTLLAVKNRRITRERDNAEAATRRALVALDFFASFLRSADPTTAVKPDITVADALQRGRERASTELQDEPIVRASLLTAMGRTFVGLGRYEEADTLLQESLKIQESVDADTALRFRTLRALSISSSELGHAQRADSQIHAALRLVGPSTEDTVVANVLSTASRKRRDVGDVDSALVLARLAVDRLRAGGDTMGVPYATLLNSLAYALRGANQLDSAEVVYQDAIGRLDPSTRPEMYLLSQTQNNLGYLLRVRGDYAAAARSYRQALEFATEVLGWTHPATMTVRQNLAGALDGAGRIDDAIEVAREQVRAAEAQWPDGHWRVADYYLALGRALYRYGRFDEAVAPLASSRTVFARMLGPEHNRTAIARAYLGASHLQSGRTGRGISELNTAVAQLRADSGLDAYARQMIRQLAEGLEQAGLGDRATPFRAVIDTTTR